MSFVEILIGLMAIIGVVGFLAMAMRPVRVDPSFTDVDLDGEPDVSEDDKRAVIEEFEAHQRELHPEDFADPTDNLNEPSSDGSVRRSSVQN